MSRQSLNVPGVETLRAATVLGAEDSGKTYILNSAAEFVTRLPPLEAGLEFTFIVGAAPSGASYTVVTHNSANVIIGHILSSDLNAASDGDFEVSGGDTISFVDSKAVKGDRVHLICDGTNWYVSGACVVFDGITITTAT
jgi:hypothetical protein